MKKLLIATNIILISFSAYLYFRADAFERLSETHSSYLRKAWKEVEELKENGLKVCTLCEEINHDYEELIISYNELVKLYNELKAQSLEYIALVDEIYD